jgi:hypothetical protein
LIDKTSSIYLYVKLKALASWIITWNQDLSPRYPPSNLSIFQIYIPPYRMKN